MRCPPRTYYDILVTCIPVTIRDFSVGGCGGQERTATVFELGTEERTAFQNITQTQNFFNKY